MTAEIMDKFVVWKQFISFYLVSVCVSISAYSNSLKDVFIWRHQYCSMFKYLFKTVSPTAFRVSGGHERDGRVWFFGRISSLNNENDFRDNPEHNSVQSSVLHFHFQNHNSSKVDSISLEFWPKDNIFPHFLHCIFNTKNELNENEKWSQISNRNFEQFSFMRWICEIFPQLVISRKRKINSENTEILSPFHFHFFHCGVDNVSIWIFDQVNSFAFHLSSYSIW